MRGLWRHVRTALLVPQNRQCAERDAKIGQAKAKGHLHDIWQAEARVDAEAAFDCFVASYGVKYDKAVGKSAKDRDVLLAFYDFATEH